MSLTFVSTLVYCYDKPNFVIRTPEHPLQSAWVIMALPWLQETAWDLAKNAIVNGAKVKIVCDSYTEQDGNRRFYNGVTEISWPANSAHVEETVAWPTLDATKEDFPDILPG